MVVFKILKTVALVCIFSFILQLSTIVFANDCQTPISTEPGNRIIPPNWRDAYKPKIYSNNDEIARNNYVNVWVYSEGRACPTYSWSVSGTGFHFDSASGPTTATTNADMETLQLWADGTACGTATITVTDLCEGNDEEYVRCTTGQWVLVCESIMPDDNCHRGGGNTYYYEGNRRIYILVRCIWDWPAPRKCWFHSCGGYDSKNYIPEDAVCWAIYDPYDCTHYLGGPGYACPGDDVGHSCCTLNLGIQVHEWVCQ